MIHKIVKFKAKRENVEKVKNLIKKFLDNIMENEPGTLYYEALQEDDLVSFIHIITFKDDKARKFHESTPYIQHYVEELNPLLEVEPTFSAYKIVRSIKRY